MISCRGMTFDDKGSYSPPGQFDRGAQAHGSSTNDQDRELERCHDLTLRSYSATELHFYTRVCKFLTGVDIAVSCFCLELRCSLATLRTGQFRCIEAWRCCNAYPGFVATAPKLAQG